MLARWVTGRLFPCQGQCGAVSSRRGRFASAPAGLLPAGRANSRKGALSQPGSQGGQTDTALKGTDRPQPHTVNAWGQGEQTLGQTNPNPTGAGDRTESSQGAVPLSPRGAVPALLPPCMSSSVGSLCTNPSLGSPCGLCGVGVTAGFWGMRPLPGSADTEPQKVWAAKDLKNLTNHLKNLPSPVQPRLGHSQQWEVPCFPYALP